MDTIAAISPGKVGGYGGPRSADERAKRHQDQANRERFDKEMENPRERFRREAAKAAFERGKKAPEPETDKDREVDKTIREFNERRAQEKEPPTPADGS